MVCWQVLKEIKWLSESCGSISYETPSGGVSCYRNWLQWLTNLAWTTCACSEPLMPRRWMFRWCFLGIPAMSGSCLHILLVNNHPNCSWCHYFLSMCMRWPWNSQWYHSFLRSAFNLFIHEFVLFKHGPAWPHRSLTPWIHSASDWLLNHAALPQ